MNLPKYFNPHLTFDTTRIVSRRTLQLEDDIDDNTEQGGDHREELDRLEVEDLRAKLDKTVSKRFKLTQTPTSSDGSHFNKRRKVQPEEGGRTSVEPRQDSEPVIFRLVSKSLPPRAIHLIPNPPKSIPVKEPPCEDTEQELKERIYRSAVSAVDLDRIKHAFPMVNNRKSLRALEKSSQSQKTASPLLLLEIPLAVPLPLPWINPRLNVPPKPSPHQLPSKGVLCPTIFTSPPHFLRIHEKKGKRRRGKPRNKNRLIP